MKLEKLKTSNNKYKYIVIGVIIAASIYTLINLLPSRASYRNTQSIPLMTGTINYKLPDLNVIAMYKDGVATDTMPGADYEIDTSSSYCYTTDSSQHDGTVQLYTNSNGEHVINNLKKGSKCFLYFVKESLSKKTLAKLEKAKGSQYVIDKTIEKGSFWKDENLSTNKLYSYPENDGTTYVFRGNVTDNWLRFGGKTWRIIRINSDGTLRVIFQCNSSSCSDTTGANTYALKSAYNENSGDNTYVGYYYGTAGSSDYSQTHSNKTKSTIAEAVTSWYNSNLTSYTSKISGSTGFCNDRRLSSGTGTGKTNTTYKPSTRLKPNPTNATPDLSCNKNDLYTLKGDVGNGNGALEVPAALITADEVVLAGIPRSTSRSDGITNNWLYTGESYSTMSPSWFSSTYHRVYSVISDGFLWPDFDVDTVNNVRPVINLKADINITGAGTKSEPFIAS